MRTVFDLAGIRNRISDLEAQTQDPRFWNDSKRAGEIEKEIKDLRGEVSFWQSLKKEVQDASELLGVSGDDAAFLAELGARYHDLEKRFRREESKIFLSGKYDTGGAIVSMYSGAGGIDAQDWAGMLLRMYQRYAQRQGYEATLLHESLGEERGVKSATVEVSGRYAYGYLKGEAGVHRLVRISPFSAQRLRHTSFALVEVLPIIPEPKKEDIEIRPEDLGVDTFRASGPGGQYVNKRESAVRIHHKPTGIIVSCQSERLQGENRERAMKMLAAKLYARKLKEEKAETSKLKGDVSPEWGSQIRSYVLHPYKMVKDHRTGVEARDAEGVLDGKLDEFIEAELRL